MVNTVNSKQQSIASFLLFFSICNEVN